MAESSKAAAKHSRDMAEEQKKAVSLLKEMADPQDARKALVNYGFRVNAEDYSMKLNEGDADMVALFHKAGISPAILDANGNSPLFRAIMLHAPNIYMIIDAALDSGQFNSAQAIQPEIDKLAKRKYFDSLNEWLAGSQRHLFDAIDAGKSIKLNNLDLGSSLGLSEFVPSTETLDFIARHKLDMKQAIKIRDAIAFSYEQNLDDWRKWLDELHKLDSSLYSALSAMRNRKQLPGQKQQEEMLNIDARRRLHFAGPEHPSFARLATTPFDDVDGAIRFCLDRRAGNRCNETIDHMLAASRAAQSSLEREIKSLNLDRARARLAKYRHGTAELARAAKGYTTTANLNAGNAKKALDENGVPAHDALRKAVAAGDVSGCETLFTGGLDPNESGNAWILFKSFIDKNPASLQILDAAVRNGFDVNREIEIAQGDALAFLSDQRELLDKWFSAGGDLEEQKLLMAGDAESDETSLNLGAILALVNIEPGQDMEDIAAKYGLDLTRGVELRYSLHTAYKDAFRSLIDRLNAFVEKENEIYRKLQTVKKCKDVDQYSSEDFINMVQVPFGSTLFPKEGDVYESLRQVCARVNDRSVAMNDLIDELKTRFPEKTKEFQEKLSRLRIKDVTARLNEYKKATASIGKLGK